MMAARERGLRKLGRLRKFRARRGHRLPFISTPAHRSRQEFAIAGLPSQN